MMPKCQAKIKNWRETSVTPSYLQYMCSTLQYGDLSEPEFAKSIDPWESSTTSRHSSNYIRLSIRLTNLCSKYLKLVILGSLHYLKPNFFDLNPPVHRQRGSTRDTITSAAIIIHPSAHVFPYLPVWIWTPGLASQQIWKKSLSLCEPSDWKRISIDFGSQLDLNSNLACEHPELQERHSPLTMRRLHLTGCKATQYCRLRGPISPTFSRILQDVALAQSLLWDDTGRFHLLTFC